MTGGMEFCDRQDKQTKKKEDIEHQIQLKREKIDDLVGEVIQLTIKLRG